MYQRYGKRVLDLVVAAGLIVIVSPLLLVIAIIIKVDSKGPVLYKQVRSGKGGEDFILYKFRSTPPENNVYDTTKGDQFTKSGIFLRKLSLDELPQLIHIIKGEMSFIGPRPWIPDYYQNMNSRQRERYNVRPGMTGLAQAQGRNNLSIEQKINYDLKYVKNITFYGDVKVVYATIKTFLEPSGNTLNKNGIHEELRALRSQNGKSGHSGRKGYSV